MRMRDDDNYSFVLCSFSCYLINLFFVVVLSISILRQIMVYSSS
jgi:hypothetical protein